MRKNFLVVRHGEPEDADDGDGALTAKGVQQVTRLVHNLHGRVSGRVLLLGSSSKRGRQTAKIITDALGCPAVFDDLLWDDDSRQGGSFSQIKEFVCMQAQGMDVLIIVGHKGHGAKLAMYLAAELCASRVMVSAEIEYGGACFIDTQAGEGVLF